jgi:hypothetical protein
MLVTIADGREAIARTSGMAPGHIHVEVLLVGANHQRVW